MQEYKYIRKRKSIHVHIKEPRMSTCLYDRQSHALTRAETPYLDIFRIRDGHRHITNFQEKNRNPSANPSQVVKCASPAVQSGLRTFVRRAGFPQRSARAKHASYKQTNVPKTNERQQQLRTDDVLEMIE